MAVSLALCKMSLRARGSRPGELIQPAAEEEGGGGGGCFIDAAAYDVSSLRKAPVFFITSLSAMLLGFWRLKKRQDN